MTEEQRQALRALFNQDYPSPLEAGLAVAKLIGCAIVPTKEIVWFEPGLQPRRIARLEKHGDWYRWVETP